MNRSLRLASLGCAAAVLVTAPWQGTAIATAQTPSVNETVQSFSQLVQRTYAFLQAFQKDDTASILKLLEPRLAAALTNNDLRANIRDSRAKLGKVNGFSIAAIDQRPGLDTVTVLMQTNTGQFRLRLLFNQQEQVVGYDLPDFVEPPEAVARNFVQALAKNQSLKARALLSPLLKTELFPQQVEQRWTALQQRTGPFQQIVNVRNAGTEAGITLLLVEVRFRNADDSLFISLDGDNRITNVDFPENPRPN
ncbi:DUF3887 domain-containing protein [Synechococcus elongatus]|uniref:DUF3887 domain-containing protein n=1 Tax=Synechococcus elongatus (strain ATCC 33912 / PCC 7942 / FACHB-805) TaxID=1140 RepID=Q31QP4_SYNE7|nr:DUF3887 domain-containing protein [Synechococcus elongatus]ABB56625.1 hypothetical protein Synpcc7942_0593 [Synechococcus elongatus PCC 7942 = FACHB-805]AJD58930.1 hypothetical protein M744_13885 [Synechococcus elongatus UTEX 2973]MBD2588970.1 DUF3887 domain-containing protein [Synechococcus elongatus FACHB-242]MBD2690036.1 DUF3887 domain-containing protein [Synechococcus elongatus FACHB-1061]MBD2708479.1 DUF3887 domain-containing protein [Synechococcus elongatus PCC 7942 = FACHB-805]